jgi:hypothetical protein
MDLAARDGGAQVQRAAKGEVLETRGDEKVGVRLDELQRVVDAPGVDDDDLDVDALAAQRLQRRDDGLPRVTGADDRRSAEPRGHVRPPLCEGAC